MLPQESLRLMKKRAAGLKSIANSKTHAQKKYFSLMLVPSYSHGKTRSIRIPYFIFYILIFTVITIATVISGLYLQQRFFRQVAEGLSEEVEQAQEEYLKLQETSEQVQSQMIDESRELRATLSQHQIISQEEKQQQQQTYQEALDSIKEQVEEMERRVEEFEEYRRQIIDQLSARSYIPPVASLLAELDKQQSSLSTVSLLSVSSDERSSSRFVGRDDLMEQLLVLTNELELQLALYANINSQLPAINQYIKNYPTRQPISGTITSYFGWRTNPLGGSGGEHHDAIDIAASSGANVRATGGGTVIRAEYAGNYGNLVVIDHGFGIHTYYAHNSALVVSAGQRVERGDVIARVGSTGRSTGPHVHYEVRLNGTPVNPTRYIFAQDF